MSVIEYVRYTVPEAQHNAFIAAYTTAQESLRNSVFCRSWELARYIPDPTQYVLRIEWRSVEAHWGGFPISAEGKAFAAAISSFDGYITEQLAHYEITSISGHRLEAPITAT